MGAFPKHEHTIRPVTWYHIILGTLSLITLQAWRDGAAASVRILMQFQSKDLEHFRSHATPSCKMIPIPRDVAMPE